MKNDINNAAETPVYILCIGMGWFPNNPGGLDRYVYELTHHLAIGQESVELCGIGLPKAALNYPIKLTNLTEPDSPLWQRLWSVRNNFLSRQTPKPDAVNLHFALYIPLLLLWGE